MTILRSRSLPLWLMAVLLAAPLSADEILLRNGGHLTGVIVEKTPEAVVIETGPGRVRLLMSRVARIVEGHSALVEYQERAAELGATDVVGWRTLARWAADRDLGTKAQEAWRQVLAASPGDPEANAALGREILDGQWMDRDQAYRARGYVRYEGRWLTPEEHEARLREQAAEDAARADRREAEARVREAEARAREAEARARDAEGASQANPSNEGGIPIWWGAAAGPPLLPPDDPEPPIVVIETPPPVPATPTSSINGPSHGGSTGDEKPHHGRSQPAHGPPQPSPKSLN